MLKLAYLTSGIAAAMLAASANAGTTTINFDNHKAPNFTGSFTIYDNSIPNVAASVNGSPFLAVPVDGARFGQAYYNSAKAITSISFDWGSPDSYNTLAFISPDHGNAFVNPIGYSGGVSGSNVTLVNGRATFNFLASDKVTKVAFASSERAFEIDNLSATAVPEPAAWALMIVGFGIVGVVCPPPLVGRYRLRSGTCTAGRDCSRPALPCQQSLGSRIRSYASPAALRFRGFAAVALTGGDFRPAGLAALAGAFFAAAFFTGFLPFAGIAARASISAAAASTVSAMPSSPLGTLALVDPSVR